VVTRDAKEGGRSPTVRKNTSATLIHGALGGLRSLTVRGPKPETGRVRGPIPGPTTREKNAGVAMLLKPVRRGGRCSSIIAADQKFMKEV